MKNMPNINDTLHEDNGIIRLTVISDDKSGPDWTTRFDQNGININESFKYSLNPEAFNYRISGCEEKFKATKGVAYEIAMLNVDHFIPYSSNRCRPEARTTIGILHKARVVLGVKPSSMVIKNAEAFCLLSEEFLAGLFKKHGIKTVFAPCTSLIDFYKHTTDHPPQIFAMEFRRGQKFIRQDNDDLTLTTYKKGDWFAFIVSEIKISSKIP